MPVPTSFARAHPVGAVARRVTGAGLAVALILVATACAGGSGAPDRAASATTAPAAASAAASTAAAGRPIEVTATACAPGWVAPTAGVRTFAVTNHGSTLVAAELDGVGPPPELTYGQVETLAPGTTRSVTASFPAGRYVWRCVPPNGDPITSAVRTVRGTARGGQSYIEVTNNEMLQAILDAQSRTQDGFPPLVAAVDRLQADADRGDLAVAKVDWLAGHLAYERLGDAYDSFGDYADEIDSRPDGLPKGVADPGWTGFLRLEYALWHGQPQATVTSLAHRLDKDVHALVAGFPVVGAAANDLPIRVHEILENSLQFQLTGQADQGSHTTLATARANVDGARSALASVTPLLDARSPALVKTATADLDHLATVLDGYHHPDGGWTALDDLTRTQREQLDAVMSQTVEDLSTIPDVLELSKDSD